MKQYLAGFTKLTLVLLVILSGCTEEDDDGISHLYEISIEKEELDYKIIKIAWSSSASESFKEYKLYRHTSSGLDETTGELVHVSTTRGDTIFLDQISHSAHFFYRVFVVNQNGTVTGSNLQEIQANGFLNTPEIIVGEEKTGSILKDEVLWFEFSAKAGHVYSIAWRDAWFKPYTSRLFVEVYNESKTSVLYYNKTIQMTGSPGIVQTPFDPGLRSSFDQKLYLKVRGDVAGSFAFIVEDIDIDHAVPLSTQISYAFSVSPFAFRHAVFPVIKDKKYNIKITSSVVGAALTDLVDVKTNVFGHYSGYQYVNNEWLDYSAENGPSITNFTIEAKNDEDLHIIFVSNYWFISPRLFQVEITTQ
jgi:hypothetical protein